jgi:hypothetical protein
MMSLPDNRAKVATARVALLFCIFFLIACGLGYPVLNRFDPRQTPGLSDVKTYASIVTGTAIVDAGDMRYRRFRVLVPWLARPFYWLARGRVATWDPVMFGLLVADSLFVAGTAVLSLFSVTVFSGTVRWAVPPQGWLALCFTWSILPFRIFAWLGWWTPAKASSC